MGSGNPPPLPVPSAPPDSPPVIGRLQGGVERGLRLFPIRRTLRHYSGEAFLADLKAAVNVALLAIPQGMACAKIAGLPVEATGIVCAAIGSILGPFFAHSRHTNLGPTNATALMVFSSLAGFAAVDRPILLAILSVMAATMLLLGAVLRMADLIQYISRSVIVGYVTGAALLIMASQLPDALGIPAEYRSGQSRTFVMLLAETLRALSHVTGPDVMISGASLLVFFLLTRHRHFKKLPCFALTLVLMAGLAQLMKLRGFEVHGLQAFSLRDLAPALPDLTDVRT